MARRKQTRGDCVFCGRAMAKGGMSKHLRACPQRKKAIKTAEGGPSGRLYHLQIQDAWTASFWLHLEMNGDADLNELDGYLRAIWLECCGHLSQFSVGGWRGDEIPMNRKIERVFAPGVELTHIYDFGTSSETLVKAVDIREGKPLTGRPIYLMARNKTPEVECVECEEPASRVCMACLIEMGEWITLCEKHAPEHAHNEDDYGEPMPVVNSPRFGMCGYYGPADPPY